MKLSKTLSRAVLLVASLCTAIQPVVAQADDVFKTRIPISVSAVNANLTAINFGTAPVGVTLEANTYFTNSTGSDLTLTAGSFTTNGYAKLVSTGCTGTISAGDSCAMTVALAVPAVGAVSGSIYIATGMAAGPDAIVLSATGLAGAPGLVSTPATESFGMGAVGGAGGAPHAITISNTGDASANISNVVSLSSSYLVDSSACKLVLAAGDSCIVQVSFTPRSLGTLSTNLRIYLADGTTLPSSALTGTGVQGVPKWTLPPDFQFYDMEVGAMSAVHQAILQNTGKGDLQILSITKQGDGAFILRGNDCPTVLVPNATCLVSLQAQVFDSNVHNANLLLTSASSSAPATKVALSARALYSQGFAAPSALQFTDIPKGQTSTQTFSLTNTGTKPLGVRGMSVDTPFTLASDCGTAIPAYGSCLINVSITPSVVGTFNGAVRLTTDSAVTPSLTVALSGNAVSTDTFDVSSASLDFGQVQVGATPQLAVSLLNTGAVPLSISTLTVSGAHFGAKHNCVDVSVGATCQVLVTYTPVSNGAEIGSLTVSDGVTSRDISLTGTGLAAALTATAYSMNFGSVDTGKSAAQTVQIVNTGNDGANLTFAIGSGYAITSGTCTNYLLAGGLCTVAVTFSPIAAQVYSSVLAIGGANLGPMSIALSGRGVAPLVTSFALSNSVLDLGPVTVGQTGSATVLVTNDGTTALTLAPIAATTAGWAVTHNCTNILPSSTCQVLVTFSPTQDGSAAGTSTMTSTGATSKLISYTGMGVSSALTAAPASLSFGSVTVGSSSVQTLSLANPGALPLNLASVISAGYTIGNSTCGASIAAHGTCTVSVTFTPDMVQPFPGTIVLSGATAGPLTIALSGTGAAPALLVPHWSLSTASANFGQVTMNSSKVLAIQVVNDGQTYLPAFITSVSGDGYSLVSGCAAALSPGDSCALNVTFNPTVSGQTFTGSISVAQGSDVRTVSLTGATTEVPALVLDGQTDFEVFNLSIDAPNAHSFKVTNASSSSVSGISFNLPTTTTSAYYRDAAADLCTGKTLSAGASCTLSVVFKPSTVGLFNQTLTVSSTQGRTSSVAMSGRGGAAVFDVAPQVVDFGKVVMGAPITKSVVFKNTGTTVILSNPSVSSSSPNFTVSTTGCATVRPGARCTIDITHDPVDIGNHSATITVSMGGTSHTVSVTGYAGEVTFDIDEPVGGVADFGPVPVTSILPVTITYRNTGTLTASLSSNSFGSNITLLETDLLACKSVAPGETCSAVVHVQVDAQDFLYGEIQPIAHFYDNVSQETVDAYLPTVIILGSGTPSEMFSNTAIAFGDIAVGATSVKSLLVVNLSTQPLNISAVSVSGNAAYKVTHNCQNIAPFGSCYLTGKFAPTVAGAVSGTMSAKLSNSPTVHTFALAGTGIAH